VTEVQVLDQHVEWVVVLIRIPVRDDDFVPKTHVFESLDDGFVGALGEGIGVETYGAREQVRILGEANEARADCLAGDTVDGEGIDGYGTVGKLNHAE
jgi:hypothetical protein